MLLAIENNTKYKLVVMLVILIVLYSSNLGQKCFFKLKLRFHKLAQPGT